MLFLPIVLGVATSPAQATVIRINYDAAAGCPGADSFFRGIHSRVESVRLAAPGEDALRVTVKLAPGEPGNIAGELRIAGPQGATVRTMEGGTCDQVVDALSLTAALALDGARPADKPPPPAPPRPSPTPVAFAVGARAITSEVVSPFVSVGGELFLRLTKTSESAVKPSLDIGVLHARNDILTPSGSVWVRLTTVALTACPLSWDIGSTWRVQPCAVGLGGWLEAMDRAVDHPTDALRSWWSVGARLRAAASWGAHYGLELEAGVSVPLVRRRFFANTEAVLVGETPIVSALGAVGFVYRF
ncbi:MAG TPA: hypothetical protein VGL13_11340 [Polyangiaceae bacterium]